MHFSPYLTHDKTSDKVWGLAANTLCLGDDSLTSVLMPRAGLTTHFSLIAVPQNATAIRLVYIAGPNRPLDG